MNLPVASEMAAVQPSPSCTFSMPSSAPCSINLPSTRSIRSIGVGFLPSIAGAGATVLFCYPPLSTLIARNRNVAHWAGPKPEASTAKTIAEPLAGEDRLHQGRANFATHLNSPMELSLPFSLSPA